jgi:hypothetical protein
MKCPYQTITTVETIKAMAKVNEDMQVVKTYFAECYKEECPWYVPERQFSGGIITTDYCLRVSKENKE